MEIPSQQEEATQLTQQVLDPRRLGRNNSGLNEADISDVLCILHPCSPAAYRIVASTAARRPQHVLQNSVEASCDDLTESWQLEEQETFIVRNQVGDNAKDLALRLSSNTIQPILGFCFGRNPRSCDITIDVDSVKRVSNLHFRIFVNQEGVLMLEDMSTNGTMVDSTHLKGKNSPLAATRMLQNGSIIQIPSSKPDESVKFIVRIPIRQGYEIEFQRKLENHVGQRLELERIHNEAQGKQHNRHQGRPAQPTYRFKGSVGISHSFGMHWDGGEKYNVVGQLGRGAFAIVYKLATKRDGHFFAAKELEKKRFIKNGRLDQRLDNELQIMKSITHPNVVQYIDYHDYVDHLYIIMEYVPCGDLQNYLSKHTYLPEAESKIMSRQVLEALRYLHSKRITHRDIKPDNILIASYDPMMVKLSDFGLSKVVNSNQTFLKTFCGTLLYCAPEVFPHYDDHIQKKGIKRRRTGSSQSTHFHQYSQSVDIWSYAAVLWLSLCGKPPFEGVVDATGNGMFHRIMETNLDISPLLGRGISRDAINLLCRMLTTDPSLRPTEIECLNHRWLFNGTLLLPVEERGLRAIAEEDDEVTAGAKFSQLSVQDPEAPALSPDSMMSDPNEQDGCSDGEEINFDSGDLDFLDPRQSKRVKADALFPQFAREETEDQAALYTALDTSSPKFNSQHFVSQQLCEDNVPSQACDPEPYEIASQELSQKKQARLFGEIGASALKSSGLLGTYTTVTLAIAPAEPGLEPTSQDYDMSGSDADSCFQGGHRSSDAFDKDAHKIKHLSLLGAESLVRDMNMESPGSTTSPGAPLDPQLNEPQTPGTPEHSSQHSSASQLPLSSFDITPRPKRPASRQVKLAEGGANFPFSENSALLRTQEGNHSDSISVAYSADGSQNSDGFDGKKGLPPSSALPIWIASEVSSPRPGLGKLTTTTDSFFSGCLRIEKENRVTHWGRDPLNTFVYPNKQDTRIPKRAIELHFHAYGIEKELKKGRDWTAMSGISTVIHTLSRAGIWVNNVKLDSNDKDGAALCGHLYTGDVITIFKNKDSGDGPESLRFICEFYVGEAASRRPADRPFKAVRATK
ncbi:Pkinase-domain-containing protein [Venturia nashicola]|uniref:Pkinase-domain-containing protein n=1 Tax=Venturia nashicola TaxID=86259 RepID=A0A4Z1NZV1_9PEZI|nr:Pkinase-domain-containing protein [Venturia nashicola]TLD26049.1 Pkinase-domain-containing protein [Venturia nashicola]